MLRAAASLLLLIASSAAAAPEWRRAQDVELRLSNYEIAPDTIRLRAGEPVRLRLINNGPTGYSLSAPDFFAAATIRPRDARAIDGGTVRVRGGETRELLLVPAAGSYALRSGNFLYRLLGMRSRIVVE